MSGSLGVGNVPHLLILLSGSIASVGAAGSELELHLAFLNSTWFLRNALLRDGGFWFMRDLWIGEIGVGIDFFASLHH